MPGEFELSLLKAISRSLPRIRGTGRAARLVQQFYNRRKRKRVQARVLGFEMDLDPSESVDGKLLFAPQLYDYREFRLLRRLLKPGDVFLDAGANIGIYSLVASRLVGVTGRVIAVEAGSFNADCLRTNCKLNDLTNVTCVQAGLSDKVEELQLACSDYGNRSGNSFLKTSSITETVSCMPLLDILQSLNLDRVNGAKLDIEGFEFRVLDAFFLTAPPHLFPDFFIFEHNNALAQKSGGDVRRLLTEKGYTVSHITDQNYLAVSGSSQLSANGAKQPTTGK
jgi:FkbM family methyltransferase